MPQPTPSGVSMQHGPKQKQICKLFQTELPLIQAVMVWESGDQLAAAATNAGVLGEIGAASMALPFLHADIRKAKNLNDQPFAVNIPLLYAKTQAQIEIALE